MKKTLYFLIAALALGVMSCERTAPRVDLVIINHGQMQFYNHAKQKLTPYEAETDSVVNVLFDKSDHLFYTAAHQQALTLKSLDLTESHPQPKVCASWKLTLDQITDEVYGTGAEGMFLDEALENLYLMRGSFEDDDPIYAEAFNIASGTKKVLTFEEYEPVYQLSIAQDHFYSEQEKFYYVAPTEDPFPFHYLQRIEEGERIGNFYMWKFAGFNSSGEWVIFDKDGDYKIGMDATDEDMFSVGNGLPRFTASWSNYLRYKNFDLNVYFRGAFGFDIFNVHEFYYGIPGMTSNVMKLAYTKNADITENPLVCDYYLEKGDYVKLDLLTLGYTFNLNNKYIDSLRLSVTGKNLLTFTSFSGVDPSTYSTNGLTPGATGSRNYYPTCRQFLVGLQVGF